MTGRIREWFKRKFPVRNSRRIFGSIYRDREWDTGETVSGPGSTIRYTEELRISLPDLLKKWEIRSLLDAPCGDYHWMSQTKLEGIEYTGADVVTELIESNRKLYPGVKFLVADITKDWLPKTDAVLCRDCFIHLSNRQIKMAIQQFKSSGIRYMIASTYPVEINEEIPTGYYRPVNLVKGPFNLPDPLALIKDYPEGEVERHLGVWDLNQLVVGS
jgi:hypothetical protein